LFYNRNDWRLNFVNLKEKGKMKNIIGSEERDIVCKMSLKCEFDQKAYPFDFQECSIKV